MRKSGYENVKWIFFDVGSTLIDEHWAYEHRMRDIADEAGVSFEEVYKRAMDFYVQNKKGDLEAAKLFGVELTKWHTEDEMIYPEATKCLEQLSKKYKIGIIANQLLGTKERLKKHGVLKFIDLVIASAEEGVSKPDKRIFEITLERAGCKPEEAVMIGDRIDNDIVPAKALGMRTIWVKQGFGKLWTIESEIEQPDYAVDSLMEICEIL